jgi:hypothetical protein
MSPALDFFTAIFSNKPANHNILVWELNRQLDTKHNNFFNNIEQAASFTEQKKPDGTDVYFCIGTLPKLKKGRGKLNDVLGIGSVHLDIDIKNNLAHKKDNLPSTIDEALNFVNSIELKPSIIISSGYGIHAYWLLKNFIDFSDDTDVRDSAAGLIESWQKMYKLKAGLMGYDVDATQDITRVLRVPDTLNWKIPDHPVKSKILLIQPDIRYTPAQMYGYLESINKTVQPAKPAANGNHKISSTPFNDIAIEIDPAATIDADTFEALQDNIPKFKNTWARTRKDLQDTSASSYDIALANMAVGAGLDDQQVCNLLIAHRRKHNDEKLRLDYLQRTIAEARNVMQAERQKVQVANKHTNADDKDTLKVELFTLLGIQIEKIEKILTEPPQFIFYFKGGKVKNMGNSAGLLDQNRFRISIGDTVSRVVKKMKEPLYESAVQKMYYLAIDVEIPDEATELGEIREILNNYLSEYLVPCTAKEHRNNATNHAPAVISNKLCIHALELFQYAKRRYGYRKEKKDLVAALKRLNAARETFNVRDDRDKQHNLSVYVLPADWMPANIVRKDSDATDFDYAGKP